MNKLIVNKLLVPVEQPLRRDQVALPPQVKEELDRMVHDGVLKQIDAADWVSNMFIAHQSNGDILI